MLLVHTLRPLRRARRPRSQMANDHEIWWLTTISERAACLRAAALTRRQDSPAMIGATNTRTASWLVWVPATSIAVIFATGFLWPTWTDSVFMMSIAVPFLTVGALVARRRPQNPVGWLFLAFSGVAAVAFTGMRYWASGGEQQLRSCGVDPRRRRALRAFPTEPSFIHRPAVLPAQVRRGTDRRRALGAVARSARSGVVKCGTHRRRGEERAAEPRLRVVEVDALARARTSPASTLRSRRNIFVIIGLKTLMPTAPRKPAGG